MFDKGLLKNLEQMQVLAEESRRKLDQLIVCGDAGNGLVNIELTGNRKLHALTINTDLKSIEKDDLEDLLSVALEKALDAADKINNDEMMGSAKGFLPSMI